MLISRFGDREQTVRLEVWATYVALLNQTSTYGGLPQVSSDGDNVMRGKRKRDSEERMDVEETPYTLLKSQIPSLSKALLAQLRSSKTAPTTLQAGFQVLHALLSVLPGSLPSQVSQIVITVKSVLSQSPTTSTSTLHLSCLSFLGLFFSTHAPVVFAPSLPTLTPVLLKSLGERHPRVAAESFRTFSALLNATRPVKNGDFSERVYDQALQRLTTNDTDAEVRACAEDCIADLWVCASDVVRTKDGREWQAICRATGNTAGAVRVVTKVAREVEMSDAWVGSCVEWVMGLLKKSGRGGKTELFTALDTLLRRYVLALLFFYRPSGLHLPMSMRQIPVWRPCRPPADACSPGQAIYHHVRHFRPLPGALPTRCLARSRPVHDLPRRRARATHRYIPDRAFPARVRRRTRRSSRVFLCTCSGRSTDRDSCRAEPCHRRRERAEDGCERDECGQVRRRGGEKPAGCGSRHDCGVFEVHQGVLWLLCGCGVLMADGFSCS